MSLTREDADAMTRRDDLTPKESSVIEDVFNTIYSSGLSAAKDDRAAALEAALIRFMFDSRRT